MKLYRQAGNSICVPIFESIFRKILLGETEKPKQPEKQESGWVQSSIYDYLGQNDGER